MTTEPERDDYYDAVPEGYHVVADLDWGELLVPNLPAVDPGSPETRQEEQG